MICVVALFEQITEVGRRSYLITAVPVTCLCALTSRKASIEKTAEMIVGNIFKIICSNEKFNAMLHKYWKRLGQNWQLNPGWDISEFEAKSGKNQVRHWIWLYEC